MTFMVTFMVEGTPVPKGRPRFARRGKFVSTYSPKTTVDYETRSARRHKWQWAVANP
jgi:Holliday junction resolvase RusA-like endonuclease